MTVLKLSGVILDSIVDGPGIRMTVFFQGCPHHCKGCHNPETWDYDSKYVEHSVEEVLNLFDSDPILSGITLSGGEPFSERNFNEIEILVKEIKSRGKNVWVYTGYTIDNLLLKYPELKERILPFIDVIVDGPFILEKRNLLCHFRGSENQRLVDVKKYLEKQENFLYE